MHVLLDEAYIHFQDVEAEDAGLRLVEAFPHLLVFRTFSKIYGLSGLRVGYAVGSPAAPSLLNALAPVLGINVLTQAAVVQALKDGEREISRRRSMVIAERGKLVGGFESLPVKATETQANFIWFRFSGMTGSELAERTWSASACVSLKGGPLGDDDHVRVAVRNPHATERLLTALRQVVAERDGATR